MKNIIFILMLIIGIATAGDSLWYGQQSAVTMTNAMNYLNSSDFLPASGQKDGVVIPNQTTSWCSKVFETTNGWYCIPKIPNRRLDALGVPEATREAFIAGFGITILTNPVLIVIDEE